MKYRLSKPNRKIQGEITLAGSKSISNRALIIQALCEEAFTIDKLANAKDTQTLQALLASEGNIKDAGPAGTTFRFMTAYLSLQEGTQVLTGSERMKKRPIGILADALNQLGANIEYLENQGYPPLKIHTPNEWGDAIEIAAGTSSQFISALLMIAPVLPKGLKLTLVGEIVSVPYIQMTLNLMAYFGIDYTWEGQTISIAPQQYQARDFVVEADWSAASYYYAVAAFADDDLDLQLNGLFEESVQGDAVIAKIGEAFGITTTFNDTGLQLTKDATNISSTLTWDFLECPDIAQTVAVMCGGLGMEGLFSGLKTLKIKETDRVMALQQELAKVSVDFKETVENTCAVNGIAKLIGSIPVFETYEDHRMAMAFAPLAMLLEAIDIEEPMVVVKSYPDFYKDFEALGFVCER